MPRNIKIVAGSIFTILILIALTSFYNRGTYTHEWHDPDSGFSYIDVHERRGDVLIYRQISKETATAHGPMKDTGHDIKRHGRWEYSDTLTGTLYHKEYWNGEEITSSDFQ